MKGRLKNKEGRWVIEYLQKLTNVDIWTNELPLHPEDVKNLEIGFTDKFTSEVEFEIVKDAPMMSLDVKYAKLLPTKEETQESWDEIHQNFRKSGLDWTLHDVFRWLKEHYLPPVKK